LGKQVLFLKQLELWTYKFAGHLENKAPNAWTQFRS